MDNPEHKEFIETNKGRLDFLYGEKSVKALKRLEMLIDRYGVGFQSDAAKGEWTEEDSIVITYGDTLVKQGEYPLQTLHNFADTYLGETISGIHILPFYPYSSDDGFSVINYRKVRDDLGGWYHITKIARHFRLMADLVINHISQESSWFNDYLKDVEPASNYFIEMDPNENLSKVIRPRSSPLLTEVKKNGDTKHVWTTFSADQVDLNFSNPDVLFEFLDLILFYISKGVSVIRLDAIAYLWKKPGTSCIHLPETHEVVKLIRSLLDEVAPHVTLITETNVPHQENIQYFGNGNEAHMIYQFSLPPLLLYTLLNEDSSYLTNWASSLDKPPAGCTYFNFTASHDGIGVRPIENLVPKEDFDSLIEAVKHRGGLVSMKKNQDGTESPYELNISYFDAMNDSPDSSQQLQVERFLCSQTIMISLQGVPGIYMHSLTATANDLEGVKEKGHNRAINRKKWEFEELNDLLDNPDSDTHQVFTAYKEILVKRKNQLAFHPEADQQVFDAGSEFFVLLRIAPGEEQMLLSVSNITASNQTLDDESGKIPLEEDKTYQDLLGAKQDYPDIINFKPYQTKWIVLK